ncbi:sigma-54-dependent transcriptional regulator [Bythopirellula polymerisocia]|uniref:DNA-binding transcriptional regulator NtrC n=1 Tax=Bythopirellula polymerisocia TaxID=2528003 RepID=A0A5C6CXR8_9BACT|nr:sigma-54 dependent transcriptional regulator [Bythopirellula polymerisocia]TWU29238.1 Nitrogen assimilation regulatory protein [Bythopirellula polymerisocia]
MSRILVVDDESAICWGIKELVKSLGHEAEIAASAEQGLKLAANSSFDLLLLDVRLPGIDGLTAMPQYREHLGIAPIVVMTAFGDLETAVRAVQNGAYEYLLKPFDLAEVRATINRAFAANSADSSPGCTRLGEKMVGETSVMQEVFKRIALAASSDVSVLLQGEPGVGKVDAAHAIHHHSSRSTHPFVVVNAGSLSPTMVETELFGHTLGTSSNSIQARNGLLAEANGGTLFLNEVAEIPLSIQAKLMRVFDKSDVLPAGSDRVFSTNFRVISATSRDLSLRVQAGEFRQDLYYRLNGFEITIPPLRERVDDILLLAQHYAKTLGGVNASFAEKTQLELTKRQWHGNLSELHDAIKHAIAETGSEVILPSHLPEPLPLRAVESESTNPTETLEQLVRRRAADLLGDPASEGLVYERLLEEIEPTLLQTAMDRFANEYAPAARALGLHRTTLKRKLDQYGMAK